ncbi:MAG: bifunctional phosphopantothenoylcysteine decarboxylase/phosphopantothenate--cysteine ligase CoaBC [Victivallaceae bacterium]|nr:bifunctional phosphopantothenoylcysteine decarboxylase/phosphopantothenate--cysteine ligase CoaBC [Victivallaceae bacterium]
MKIVISAGPTRESIDTVRFISNRSSGKMGYALASAAAESGMEVVLISGPVTLPPPPGNIELIKVETAAQMAIAVKTAATNADIVIMSAAVADYRPLNALPGKLKKSSGNLVIEFERTEDILASLGEIKRPGQILCGFAAETDNLISNAKEKLSRKNLDWIIANDIGKPGQGFAGDRNAVTMLSANGQLIELALADKAIIAQQIIAEITSK